MPNLLKTCFLLRSQFKFRLCVRKLNIEFYKCLVIKPIGNDSALQPKFLPLIFIKM